MRMCFKLAVKGRGVTNPNPMVGAIVVKNGRIIGKGFHRMSGLPHAEVEAIKEAGDKAKGASLYVNLEPCRHYGRTPPCTQAIIKSGIREVFAAMLDPNPLNNGKGIEELRRNRIKIKIGILGDEARILNEVFIKFITEKMPFVVVKAAQSLDGKIATAKGESKWISSEKSRRFVKKIRSEFDAILVGVNTIIKDNPLLNVERKTVQTEFSSLVRSCSGQTKEEKQYCKIVLDSKLRIPQDAKIFSPDSHGKVILATTKFAPRSKIDLFKKQAEVLIVRDKEKKVSLRHLMKELARRGISHLLIEGGGEVIASALEARVVDKILYFIAPRIIGGKRAITSAEGSGANMLKDAPRVKDMKVRWIGEDLLIEGYLQKDTEG